MNLVTAACRVGAPLLLMLAAGCASQLQVRPLATARIEQSAFELHGSQLAVLQREAQRLCPQGADILRQSQQDQRPEQEQGRLQRWANQVTAWVDPPQRQAQLVVQCREPAVDATPGATAAVAAGIPSLAESAAAARSPAPPPIGPLMIEW